MKVQNIYLEQVSNAYDKVGKVKGLLIWKEILHNKIKSKNAFSDMVKNYESLRKQILEELCEKDESGKPVIKEDKYSFIDDNESKAVAAINDLSKETLDAFTEIDLKVVSLDDFKKIETEVELADILEPLLVSGVINED